MNKLYCVYIKLNKHIKYCKSAIYHKFIEYEKDIQ